MNQSEHAELEKWIDIITEKAAEYGLDTYPTHFEVVPDHIIYELGSYSLPARFSHWTFGRDYHRQKTSYEYGMSKIYEIVFNTDPCQAFLMDSNSMLSHKFVIAHVLGHNDFFKNNVYFEHTDRRMIEKVRLHGNRIRKYEEEYGPQVVEDFLDAVLSIEEHFDTGLTTSFRRKTPEQHETERRRPRKPSTEFDDLWDVIQTNTGPEPPAPRKFPPEPDKDLIGFLRDHAPDLERWQRDILNMIREEMIYFIPQMRTKIINEGWACATRDSLLVTERGLLRFDTIVHERQTLAVASGKPGAKHTITDFHKEENVPTIRVTTQRGYTIEGALEHRLQMADGSWAFLKDVTPGARIVLAQGTEVWPQEPVKIDHVPDSITLHKPFVDTALAHVLGYFVGDGNRTKSGICMTCGDDGFAEMLQARIHCVFGVPATLRADHTETGSRWRIEVHSRELLTLLESLGVDLAARARTKKIPEAILRSPRAVVAAFLRGLFDADGYAGKAGVILSTASAEMARTVQILLLNFGILCSQRKQSDGCTQVRIAGASAKRFHTEIGFDLERKSDALDAYVNQRLRFKREDATDAIVAIEHRTDDVYDITVETAHAYVANGFVHHNSYWHEKIMTDLPLTPEEHLEFRRLHASVLSPGSRMSVNPYYVGYNILRDIERRWEGIEDPDFPETDWREERLRRPSGEGMKKLFEVRTDECDATLLRKYLTQGLVNRLDMYTYRLQEIDGEKMWVVQDTDWRHVRDTLLDSMTNFGIPIIHVDDADYQRRGELLLTHAYDGKPLDPDYTGRTLKNIYFLWKRPVHLRTLKDDKPILFTHDGEKFTEQTL